MSMKRESSSLNPKETGSKGPFPAGRTRLLVTQAGLLLVSTALAVSLNWRPSASVA